MDKRVALVLLATIGLAGCGTVGTWPFTGGSHGPVKGNISGDTYTSQDEAFSIALPYPAGSAERQQRRVKERRHPHEYYVSFGYGPPNLAFYRVDVTMRANPGRLQPSFDEIARKDLAEARKKIEQGYGSKTNIISGGRTKVDGRSAYYWKLEQTVPAFFLGTKKPEAVEHDIYAINFRYAVAVVWVQHAADAAGANAAMSAERFAESLKLLPPRLPDGIKLMSNGAYRFSELPVEVRSPAELCGVPDSYPYVEEVKDGEEMDVDFVAPDYLWQISGDYFLFARHIPSKVTDKQSFVSYMKKADASFIPDNSKPLGLHFKQIGFKETKVNGLPAVEAIGVDKGKAVLVTTAVLHSHVLTVSSVIYPLEAGADPNGAAPYCYKRFVSGTREIPQAQQ